MSQNIKKILVFGSNSFTGSYFINHTLEKTDAKIIGVSRSKEYDEIFLPYLYKKQRSKNFKFYQLDLNKDFHQIAKLIDQEEPEVVVNYAAQGEVRNSWKWPEQWFQTNCLSTVKIADLSEINNMLKDSPLVSEVVFQKDVVSVLTSWTNALRSIGFGLIIVLSLVSIFIMVIIIGIKISQKKQDIEIMRLIGAGGWYIRWPFLFEGIFYGGVGAILGWLISAGALWYATPFLSSFLKGIPIFPLPLVFLFGLLGTEILVAIILGVVSSFVAVLRYLK